MSNMPTVLEGEAQEIAKSGLTGEAAVAALSKRIFELGREREAIEAAAKALIADCSVRSRRKGFKIVTGGNASQ